MVVQAAERVVEVGCAASVAMDAPDDSLVCAHLTKRWVAQTVWERFEGTAHRWPDSACIETGSDAVYTYRQVESAAKEIAVRLAQMGVGCGTRVALRCESSVGFVLVSLALYSLGAVKVALSEAMGPYEESYKLAKVDARLLIEDVAPCDPEQPKGFDGALLRIDWGSARDGGPLEQWVHAFERPLASIRVDRDAIAAGNGAFGTPDDLADIFFTSGSTGSPKAVGLSHDMMLRSAWSNCVNRGFAPGHRLCVPLPLSHVYGYIDGFLALLCVGGSLLLPGGKLRAGELVRFLSRRRAQDVLLVPNLAISLIEAVERGEAVPSCLEQAYCSASSCPGWLWSALRRTFRVGRLTTGYGMTEVAGASLQLVLSDSDDLFVDFAGMPMEAGSAAAEGLNGRAIEYKVVDEHTGARLPLGATGELCCRGATVFSAYLNDVDATRCAFDAEGWFHTGDIGRFDGLGRLTLEGRAHEGYKINGENVSPRFVEGIVGKCEVVRSVRIVGVPEKRYGEVGAAFVELTEDSETIRQAVRDFCQASLARYQVPKYYFFVDREFWPVTPTGKVSRVKLKEWAVAQLCVENREA